MRAPTTLRLLVRTNQLGFGEGLADTAWATDSVALDAQQGAFAPVAAVAVRGGRELCLELGEALHRSQLRVVLGHRGQDRVRPPLLQHQLTRLQHRPADLPRNMLAGAFGFHLVAFFEAGEADRAVPQVSFANPPVDAPPSPPAGS
jgi:hypothetical protein